MAEVQDKLRSPVVTAATLAAAAQVCPGVAIVESPGMTGAALPSQLLAAALPSQLLAAALPRGQFHPWLLAPPFPDGQRLLSVSFWE